MSAVSQSAYFSLDDESFVPSSACQGPWGDAISGHVIGGLLGRAVESASGDPGLQPARLTVDLLRPALMEPVRVHATVRREGKRIKIIDAAVSQRGSVVVSRASSLFLRRGHDADGAVWAPSVTMPPMPTGVWARRQPAFELWAYGPASQYDTTGGNEIEWQQAEHRKFAWVRETRALVEGESLTPFVRAALAGDVTSALTHWGTDGLRFINADFTVTLSRLPEGEFIGLASDGHYSTDGVASGAATLFDDRGPVGHAVTMALAQPVGAFRPSEETEPP